MSHSAPSRSIPSLTVRPGAALPFAAAALGAAVLAASLTPAPAAAIDERFNGAWQKDETRSDPPWRPPGTPATKRTDTKIDITLVGEDLMMVFTLRPPEWNTPVQVTASYITDNKPQQAPDFAGGMREVRARWRKKKLEVSYTVKTPWFEADVQETWEISKDGNDLIQTNFGRTAENPRPDIRKNYFVRATDDQ